MRRERPRTLPWRERRRHRRAALRGVLATALSGTAAVAVAGAARSAWTAAQDGPQPADAVHVTALGLTALAAAWLTVLLAAATASVLPGVLGVWGRRLGALVAPRAHVRVAALLLGASIASGVGAPSATAVTAVTAASAPATQAPAPALALTDAPGKTSSGAAPAGTGGLPDPSFAKAAQVPPGEDCLPEPGWRPARAKVRRQHSDVGLVSGCPTQDRAVETQRRVVRRGDTLWGIAASALGPDATPAEIARAWPQWYAANRDVIGDDPDLLLPGQVLTAPDFSEVGR